MITTRDAELLKAWFTAHSFDYDMSSGGCETCGYGGKEGFTISSILDQIDEFTKLEENK